MRPYDASLCLLPPASMSTPLTPASMTTPLTPLVKGYTNGHPRYMDSRRVRRSRDGTAGLRLGGTVAGAVRVAHDGTVMRAGVVRRARRVGAVGVEIFVQRRHGRRREIECEVEGSWR